MAHLASLLIRLSRDIYTREDFSSYPEVNNGEYFEDEPTDTEISLVRLNDGTLVIVFQGTDSNIDVKANEDFLLVRSNEYDNIRVHRGFYLKWESVKDKVLFALQGLPPRSQVVFTGHSLGGSLATMAGLACSALVPSHTYNIVSFGAPRSGSCALRAHIASSPHNFGNSAHYINANDVVPNLPPNYLGYRDAIPRNYLIPKTEGWWKYNLRTLKVFFGKGTNPDHSIHKYVELLNQN